MPINPISASRDIAESYISYLTTAFPLRGRELARQFGVELSRPGRFVKGPILEATPPFMSGVSVADLTAEGVLSREFMRVPESQLPPNRPLYLHQERAIRKAVSARRNLVVASGTGSGKTETFLVPILNHLFRQKEKGKLGPGVRALLLYPMNALANDQMARLRKLLRNHPDVTFGRYTGETKTNDKEARDLFIQMFREEPLPNELVSRESMQASPPHILLTNYAMLEYLLLRPQDAPFFDGMHAREWRFIVLDEAHTYTGARGIEIAMLLRRLKDRVVAGKEGLLQCFATSATLGRGVQDAPEIVEFATRIFGEPFEWIEGDNQRQDVIVAERRSWIDDNASAAGDEYTPCSSLYEELASSVQQGADVGTLVDISKIHGVPQKVLIGAATLASGQINRFLYHVLRVDSNVLKLRTILQEGPGMIDDLAKTLFPDDHCALERLVAMVELASRAKPEAESLALLPARYHMFVRAIEGAYLQFAPERRVILDRTTKIEDEHGKTWPVFEMASCRNCGALYLAGKIEPDTKEPGTVLVQSPAFHEESRATYFLVEESMDPTSSDEDDEVFFGDQPPTGWERFQLCTECGRVWPANSLFGSCSCRDGTRLILLKSPRSRVNYCPSCGRRNPLGQVSRFFTGDDAAASVITTAMHQAGATEKVVAVGHVAGPLEESSQVNIEEPDDPLSKGWYEPGVEESSYLGGTIREDAPLKLQPSRLLVFSDGRQDAAYFAPYLNRTYERILGRRLIRRIVEKNIDSVRKNKWRLRDLVEPMVSEADIAGLFDSGVSYQGKITRVWKWLMAEFIRLDRHNSLESLGLISFAPVRPVLWSPPRPLLGSPWNLSPGEVWMLLRALLDNVRMVGAVTFPAHVSPKDEEFSPRNRPSYFRGEGSDARRHVLAWSPAQSRMNARLDYMLRLAQRIGIPDADQVCREYLRAIWRHYLVPAPGTATIWGDHFVSITLGGAGTVYQLNHEMWEVDIPSEEDEAWYRCDTCGTYTRVNVKGVCPSYLCKGKLRPVADPTVRFDNHYKHLYAGLKPVRLTAEEHTAQLKSDAAAELQTKFARGEVNVLSCSTTFELGVDLGSLEIVFLRNMPPTPANYVQRAGRAGRRTESAAFVTTYARRRPHDREFFRDPFKMVSGRIKPPHFSLENGKVVSRHIAAMALAFLWKMEVALYGRGRVQDFFVDNTGPTKLRALLESRPGGLLSSIRRTVPPELHEILGVETWRWVDELFHEEIGHLVLAAEEYHHDREELEKVLSELQAKRKRSDQILDAIRTIDQRDLIGYLAARGVLPKYGFPVDVVEMKISYHCSEAKILELNRDLRIALSEYAPGSSIIAGGKTWTSRYLRIMPRRALPRFRYALCPVCGSYHRVWADTREPLTECSRCHASLTDAPLSGEFVIPEFGFLSEYAPPGDPPPSAPERVYSTRAFLWGESFHKEESAEFRSGRGVTRCETASKARLAVLNTGLRRGFRICPVCGYTFGPNESAPRTHNNPRGQQCPGTFQPPVALGHEFETDVLLLTFPHYRNVRPEFWVSLLYAVVEGVSLVLDIERNDLDGCLYPMAGDPYSPALVLFDDVPGGAGHVRRINNETLLKEVLETTLRFVSTCECGTSCSGCLRNYKNQSWHEILDRLIVKDFLEQVIG